MTLRSSFSARGGWWVVAQVPLLLIAAALSPWTANAAWPPVHIAQWLGVGFIVAGGTLAVAGMLTLGDALTPYPYPREGATHRTHGVYALVRHPIYGGLILGGVGWAVLWFSWIGLAYGVAVAAFFDRKATREEHWLNARLPTYAAYQRKTRKQIPWMY